MAALHPLGGRDRLHGRGVRAERFVPVAEEPPHRRLDELAERIPHRDLDGPRPGAVEVDRLADLVHGVGLAQVEPDEQPLEQGAIGEPVPTGSGARHPVVRVDEHDGRVLLRARPRVPRDREGGSSG
jgi:hypothetical protein